MKKSRLISIRLPADLEEALREAASDKGVPWQTYLKDVLYEAVGLKEPSAAEVKRFSSSAISAAAKRLRR